ncbi:MAG: hypothetical protein WAM82_23590 [Thermoanaerobaculia bacterium]
MTAPEFQPVYREDGSLDPQCLEDAGRHWLRKWLEGRFSGRDPFFGIDRRTDEDPEALVVHLLQEAGTAHPVTLSISEVLLSLLDQAREAAPDLPPFFFPALGVCQQVRLPATASWFNEELATLARGPEAEEARWGGFPTTKEIVYAAIIQSPGLPRAAAHSNWLLLLKVPHYSTLALLGLGQTFEQRLPWLSTWWKSCPPEDRQRELDHLVFMALRELGERKVRTLLATQARTDAWLQWMKAEVDSALLRSGGQVVFADEADTSGGADGEAEGKVLLYPEIRVALRSRSRYALVNAINLSLRQAGVPPQMIEKFSREALTTQDPRRFEELWNRAVETSSASSVADQRADEF